MASEKPLLLFKLHAPENFIAGGGPVMKNPPSPPDPDFAARVRASFARQGFMASLGAELTGVEPGAGEIRLPYQAGLSQQHGYFHAGALSSIADSAGGYAA